jgi:hypothetical protein
MTPQRRIAPLLGLCLLSASVGILAQNPVDGWAAAIGGRQKIAAIKAIYREATIDVAGAHGSLKAWHTSEGRYRKEENIDTFSSIETFDGVTATVWQGEASPRTLSGAELQRARSSAFANSNAMFFVFPERRHGILEVEGDHGMMLKPDGGFDWHVTLDPKTFLPATMTHAEGDRVISVTFVSYETVDGLTLEREIHRSTGMPQLDATIRFTKTVINPPIPASLFSRDLTSRH